MLSEEAQCSGNSWQFPVVTRLAGISHSTCPAMYSNQVNRLSGCRRSGASTVGKRQLRNDVVVHAELNLSPTEGLNGTAPGTLGSLLGCISCWLSRQRAQEIFQPLRSLEFDKLLSINEPEPREYQARTEQSRCRDFLNESQTRPLCV